LGLNKPLVEVVDDQEGDKMALIKEKEFSPHLRSLIITILFWVSLLFSIIEMSNQTKESEYVAFTLSKLCAFLMIPIYYIECACAATGLFVKNKMNVIEIRNHLDYLKATDGSLCFHAMCYHYVTRTRTVYSTDSQGRSQSRTETYEEMVVTHTASENFIFTRCEDNTGKTDINFEKFTKLQINAIYDFADEKSRGVYEAQMARFKSANTYDLYQLFTEEFTIPGLEKKVLVIPSGSNVPCCMNRWMYILVSIVGLSYFYRVWLEKKTQGKDLNIVKTFHCQLDSENL